MDQRALARLVRRAASALGLEVYGGDAIATATGELVLLDVNAWPSFALYRDEASAAIASYLALRFSGARR
jgi:D-alanine-D-alanine ligase-like ATP-grasp enzyme